MAADRRIEDATKVTERTGKVYKYIAQTLVGEIESGLWPVGQPLPTEQELVDRFKASRNTVREALRNLKDAGYIKRKQGARSLVASSTAVNPFVNMVAAVDDLNIYIKDTRSLLLSVEHVILSDKAAEAIRSKPGSRQLRVLFLRWRKDNAEPLCYTEAYVAPQYQDVVESLGDSPTIYDRIEAHYGITITHIHQEIEAQRADANVASRLQVAIGSPLLIVKTFFYVSEDEIAEVSISHYPEQRYRLRINLSRRYIEGGGAHAGSARRR